MKTPLAALAADANRLREAGQSGVADGIDEVIGTMRRHVDRERASLAPMSERAVRIRRPPVSLDEVIDAHEFLEQFEGDVRVLFAGKGKVVGSTES